MLTTVEMFGICRDNSVSSQCVPEVDAWLTQPLEITISGRRAGTTTGIVSYVGSFDEWLDQIARMIVPWISAF